MVLLANILWFFSCLPKYFLFLINAGRVRKKQEQILKRYLKRHANTEFGRQYNFLKIKSVKVYRENVPIFSYEDFLVYIKKIKNGEQNILTRDKVLFLEPTSGSTSASKYIPYTNSLKREFQTGIGAWIIDLFLHCPSLLLYKAYWLITPNNQQVNKDKNVGFDDDSEYLGFFSKLLVNRILVVPNIVSKISNEKSFFYVTLLFLLKNKNIGLLSIWSPTILDLYIKFFQENFDSLILDLGTGEINKKIIIDNSIRSFLQKELGKNLKRANEIKSLINLNNNSTKSVFETIWPRIKVISCWQDASSKKYAENIKKYFPNAEIQGKGLISTECFATFPLAGVNGKVLSVNSHFFEFQELIDEKKLYLAHELKKGGRYRLIVTTGGGLYRYNTGDAVEIAGFYNQAPIINFIGKIDNVSDLFGEKINEQFVNQIVKELINEYQVLSDFFLVSPEEIDGKGMYVLFIEINEKRDLSQMEKSFENKLCQNFHYNHCRKLGQLNHARIFIIERDGLKDYYSRCLSRGQKLGDIKNKVLDNSIDWSKYFKGHYNYRMTGIHVNK
ncbi:MAG: GH3 auxin-responsive promoter family protein [Candidatus Parcubacteria bacterium]|nr:GH3 auxin-responsive promoter family protein [Candidatus Parcubacteria bacterium]